MPRTAHPANAATRRFFRALGMTRAGFTSTPRHRGEVAANPHNRRGEEKNHKYGKNNSHYD